MDLGIDGNAALVTASSSGLGKASATALARAGANVVVNGRDADRLEAAVEAIRDEATGEVVGQAGDITDPDDVAALVRRAVDEFGGLAHLVTSAGGPPRLRPLEATDDDWYEAYDLLVMSVVRAVREAAEHLRADGGGTVVTITSRTVKEGRPGNVLSSAVRTAVVGFEKTLSRELAPAVRANAVLPGSHDTPRVATGRQEAVDRGEFETPDDAYDALREGIPVGRLGDPAALGDAVAYLSSPRASFVNGQAIVIDGGAGGSTF